MKKKYMSPAINVVKLDGKLMQSIAIGSGNADAAIECGSKRGTITFTDDDDDDYATGW